MLSNKEFKACVTNDLDDSTSKKSRICHFSFTIKYDAVSTIIKRQINIKRAALLTKPVNIWQRLFLKMNTAKEDQVSPLAHLPRWLITLPLIKLLADPGLASLLLARKPPVVFTSFSASLRHAQELRP
ncbi:hypothetical protein AOLI_G00163130 [Acnodon oligacanthus]